MNANNRSSRAARRVRTVQSLTTVIRDELQDAESELYIDGVIRCADEADALRSTSKALSDLEERLVNLMEVLRNIRDSEDNPEYTEFDGLTKEIFHDSQ